MNSSLYKVIITLYDNRLALYVDDYRLACILSRAYSKYFILNTTTFFNKSLILKVFTHRKQLKVGNCFFDFGKKQPKVSIKREGENNYTLSLTLLKYNMQNITGLFDWIFHLLLQKEWEKDNYLHIHGALINLRDKLYLIPGRSGLGKTTTSNILINIGGTKLADDVVFVPLEKLLKIDCLIFIYKKFIKPDIVYETSTLFNSVFPIKNIDKPLIIKYLLSFYKKAKKIRIAKDGVIKTEKNLIQLVKQI